MSSVYPIEPFLISRCSSSSARDTTSLVYVKACVHTCMEARGQCGLSSSIALHHIFWDRAFPDPGAHCLARLLGTETWNLPVFEFPVLLLQKCATMANFLRDAEGPSTDPHTSMASTESFALWHILKVSLYKPVVIHMCFYGELCLSAIFTR